MNGVLNCSVLDGWWPEACEHGDNGWAIGNEEESDQERDLESLYATLEHEILPAYGDRSRWLTMMQSSIEMAERGFSSDRMVREYFERLYAR